MINSSLSSSFASVVLGATHLEKLKEFGRNAEHNEQLLKSLGGTASRPEVKLTLLHKGPSFWEGSSRGKGSRYQAGLQLRRADAGGQSTKGVMVVLVNTVKAYLPYHACGNKPNSHRKNQRSPKESPDPDGGLGMAGEPRKSEPIRPRKRKQQGH